MRLGMGGIDHEPFEIRLVDDSFEQLFSDAFFSPATEAAVRVLPVAILRRQIAPWSPTAENPDNGIEKEAVIFCDTTPDAGLSRQMRCNELPGAI